MRLTIYCCRKIIPSASWSSWVSLLFLYGTWAFFWAREAITSPKAESDLLICWASLSLSPVASVLSALSLPARSTRCIQPRIMLPDTKFFPWTWTVKQLRLYTNYQISSLSITISPCHSLATNLTLSLLLPVRTTATIIHGSRTNCAIFMS